MLLAGATGPSESADPPRCIALVWSERGLLALSTVYRSIERRAAL